jgi:hypothetical protein
LNNCFSNNYTNVNIFFSILAPEITASPAGIVAGRCREAPAQLPLLLKQNTKNESLKNYAFADFRGSILNEAQKSFSKN